MQQNRNIDPFRRFYSKGGYAPAPSPSRLKDVERALYASQYYEDGGEVDGYAGGGKFYRWVKGLASNNSSDAERKAMDFVADYGRKTGDEALVVGNQFDPTLSEALITKGDRNSAPLPARYSDFMMNNSDVFSAHDHTHGHVSPSEGDVGVWGNYLARFAGVPSDAIGRQSMWIKGIQGPHDTSYMEPAAADVSRRVAQMTNANEIFARRGMVSPETRHRYLAGLTDYMLDTFPIDHFDDARKATRRQIGHALDGAYSANRLSEHLPLYLDPQTKLHANIPDTIGDRWPDLLDYLGKRDVVPYAEGGPVQTSSEEMGRPDDLELAYASQYYGGGGRVHKRHKSAIEEDTINRMWLALAGLMGGVT